MPDPFGLSGMLQRQRLRGRQPVRKRTQRAGGVAAFGEKGADLVAGRANISVPAQIVGIGVGEAAADGKARIKMIERLGVAALLPEERSQPGVQGEQIVLEQRHARIGRRDRLDDGETGLVILQRVAHPPLRGRDVADARMHHRELALQSGIARLLGCERGADRQARIVALERVMETPQLEQDETHALVRQRQIGAVARAILMRGDALLDCEARAVGVECFRILSLVAERLADLAIRPG